MSKADPGQANLFEDTRTAAVAGAGKRTNAFTLPALRIIHSRAPLDVIDPVQIQEILMSHGVAHLEAAAAVCEASEMCFADGSLLVTDGVWIRGMP